MKIPHEWVSEVINNVNSMLPGTTMEAEETFAKYWYTDFNNTWDLHKTSHEAFKMFL